MIFYRLLKTAAYIAGQMIHDLEVQGVIAGPKQLEKTGQDLGTAIKEIEKKAYQLGFADGVKSVSDKTLSEDKQKEIVKKAAADTAEAVLQDIAKKELGKVINGSYGSLVNP